MKNIVTILLIFSLNSTFAQNINYALIDTLCKRSDFVSVIELIEIDHVHGISLDLFNEISYIKYKIINTYNHKNNNHLSSQQKNIKIVDEFQFIHRCETEEGDTCTFRQFKIGDTCIIFLKLKDTLSNTVELTCHGNSPMHLAKISSLYKKSFLLYSYLKSVYWTTNKEKIINSKEIVGKKEHKISSWFTESGVLLRKSISYYKGNKEYHKTWEYDPLSNQLEKFSKSKIKPVLNKRKYPAGRGTTSVRVKYVERDGKGKIIKRTNEVMRRKNEIF